MESNRASAPYYCFKCEKYLHPEHIQDYLCRFCNTGFVEEVVPGVNNLTDDDQPNSSENGVNLGQLLGMFMGGGGNNAGGSNESNNDQPSRSQSQPRQRAANPTSDFLQSTVMPAFFQALASNNTGEQNNTRRASSSGPSDRARRQGAGGEMPSPQGGGFIEELIRNLIPANAAIRIQVGGSGGNGNISVGNWNLGDFATDAGFDDIVSQILSQFDPSANSQRISEEDLQHLPRTKVNQERVADEAQCTTCMDTFHLEEEVAELSCHHIFHPDCIIPWLRSHNTCPICRQTVDPANWSQNPSVPLPPEQRNGFRDVDELD